MSAALNDPLAGATHLCRCWAVTRQDGQVFGFTDHDVDLSFDGVRFRAGSGLNAFALQQTTGLSVDNSEAIGALQSDAIRDDDIAAGRFDGARVQAWTVVWDNVEARQLDFTGTIGAITRKGPSFTAELRGLTEMLNVSSGRVFHRNCPFVLGDSACGVDLAALTEDATVVEVSDDDVLHIEGVAGHADGWFARGVLELASGDGVGLRGVIKTDRQAGSRRLLQLWTPLPAALRPNDPVRLIAGCDKQLSTCKTKFANIAAFGGFPHIPGEDWLMSVPRHDGQNDGGSLS